MRDQLQATVRAGLTDWGRNRVLWVLLGIAQDPMLYPAPPTWAHFLPGYRGFQVLTDATLTPGFTQGGALLVALAWLVGAAVAAGLLFRRNMRPARLALPLAEVEGPGQDETSGLDKPSQGHLPHRRTQRQRPGDGDGRAAQLAGSGRGIAVSGSGWPRRGSA